MEESKTWNIQVDFLLPTGTTFREILQRSAADETVSWTKRFPVDMTGPAAEQNS